MKKTLISISIVLLSGCAAPELITGLGVASIGVNETTGKTITDHAISGAENKDCKISRIFKNQPTCIDAEPVTTHTKQIKDSDYDSISAMNTVLAKRMNSY